MTKPHLALVAPATVIGTVDVRRAHRAASAMPRVRAREYLTDGEVGRLIAAAGGNRHGHRDATAVWSRIGMGYGRPSW